MRHLCISPLHSFQDCYHFPCVESIIGRDHAYSTITPHVAQSAAPQVTTTGWLDKSQLSLIPRCNNAISCKNHIIISRAASRDDVALPRLRRKPISVYLTSMGRKSSDPLRCHRPSRAEKSIIASEVMAHYALEIIERCSNASCTVC